MTYETACKSKLDQFELKRLLQIRYRGTQNINFQCQPNDVFKPVAPSRLHSNWFAHKNKRE